MSKIKLYPIHLSPYTAKELIERYCGVVQQYPYRYAEYLYSGKLLETGDVELRVTCSFDDGFCKGSGCCLSETIKAPFTEKDLERIVADAKRRAAEEEYVRREEYRVSKEVEKIQFELFGN